MNVLPVIENFLRRTGTPQTRFGRDAVGDAKLVTEMRNGRELRERTAARILAHIRAAEGRDGRGA